MEPETLADPLTQIHAANQQIATKRPSWQRRYIQVFSNSIDSGFVKKRHLPLEVRLVPELAIAAQPHPGNTLDLPDLNNSMVQPVQPVAAAEIVPIR